MQAAWASLKPLAERHRPPPSARPCLCPRNGCKRGKHGFTEQALRTGRLRRALPAGVYDALQASPCLKRTSPARLLRACGTCLNFLMVRRRFEFYCNAMFLFNKNFYKNLGTINHTNKSTTCLKLSLTSIYFMINIF